MSGISSEEKVENIKDGSYYFIFPEGTTGETIQKKLPRPGKNYSFMVGAGLTLTSLIFEVAVKPRLLEVHERFEAGVPLYTKYSFLITILILTIYFAFIFLRNSKIEYTTQKIEEGKLKVIPADKEDKLQSTFVMAVLVLYAGFVITAVLWPILQMLMK